MVNFFVLDMCSKLCSKVAQKGKICSNLLEPQKEVAQKLPSTIGKGLIAYRLGWASVL